MSQDCSTCGKAWRCMAACEAKNAECCKVDDELSRAEREEGSTIVHGLEPEHCKI
jgi:hypothetical protein